MNQTVNGGYTMKKSAGVHCAICNCIHHNADGNRACNPVSQGSGRQQQGAIFAGECDGTVWKAVLHLPYANVQAACLHWKSYIGILRCCLFHRQDNYPVALG